MDDRLICPACGKPMTEVLIENRGIAIDICLDGCGGIYFDNREMKKFTDSSKDIDEIVSLVKDKNFKKPEEGERHCPVCGMKMVKNSASPKNAVTIDQCYNCGGIFLDHGELTAIREEYKDRKENQDEVNKLVNEQFGAVLSAAKEEAEKARRVDTLREVIFKMIGL